jgi:hypothetical protein
MVHIIFQAEFESFNQSMPDHTRTRLDQKGIYDADDKITGNV